MLLFGTKKLRNIGSDLGGAVKGFKSSMKEGEEEQNKQLKENNATAESDAQKDKEKDQA